MFIFMEYDKSLPKSWKAQFQFVGLALFSKEEQY